MAKWGECEIDALLALTNFGQVVFSPVLLWQKRKRFQRRGESYEWDKTRWDCPFPDVSPDERAKKHLVFVAMGFAETRLAVTVANELKSNHPDWRFSFAIRNRAAAEKGGAIPEGAVIAPMPFDFSIPCRNLMKNTQPDVVVFIERFWFANFVRAAHNGGAKVAAIAARTRDHRGFKYRLTGFYNRWILAGIDLLCLRSNDEKVRLGAAVPPELDIQITGSLKFWPQIPNLEANRKAGLERWLDGVKGRTLLAAGSTQIGDEGWIYEAFLPLRNEKGAVLLFAPRNPPRADEIEKMAIERGLKVSRRSRDEKSAADVDVLLLDTVGELMTAYGFCAGAFIGGTILGTGHNVLEPIAHGIPVCYGPKRGTFGAEQQMCETAGVGFQLQNAGELEAQWRRVFEAGFSDEMREKCARFNREGAGSWHKTVVALEGLMKEVQSKGSAV